MQSFTKSSDNDDVVYTHWSGTTYRLPWQDVVQLVECTVQEAEQLDRPRLPDYNTQPDFDDTQRICAGSRHLRYTQAEMALRELIEVADRKFPAETTLALDTVLAVLCEAAQLQERVDVAAECLMCSDISDHHDAVNAYKILSGQMPVVKLNEDVIRQYEKKQLRLSRAAYHKLDGEFEELVGSIRKLAAQAGVIEPPNNEEDDD